jgi:hypothetical protein
MGDLREGVSPVVHRVLDKAEKLRVSMARMSNDDVCGELELECIGVCGANASADFERVAALAILCAEREGFVQPAEVKP